MKKNILILFALMLAISSCTKTSDECGTVEYTYNQDVKSIIDKNCSTSGCHEQGASIGDMSNFNSLETYLKNGKFNIHVFVKKDMPKMKVLSDEDKQILNCWYDSGFDE